MPAFSGTGCFRATFNDGIRNTIRCDLFYVKLRLLEAGSGKKIRELLINGESSKMMEIMENHGKSWKQSGKSWNPPKRGMVFFTMTDPYVNGRLMPTKLGIFGVFVDGKCGSIYGIHGWANHGKSD